MKCQNIFSEAIYKNYETAARGNPDAQIDTSASFRVARTPIGVGLCYLIDDETLLQSWR